MNPTNIIFGVALLAFGVVPLSYSLKCFVCNSKDTCKKPQLYECSQMLAIATHLYLERYHMGVPVNAPSNKYNCFDEYIQTTSFETYYKGCTYSNAISGCKLPLIPYINATTINKKCYQCANKDGCNTAGRVNFNVITLFTTVAVVLLYIRNKGVFKI